MKPDERDQKREQARAQYGVTRLVAIAAAVFSLTVFSLMVINHLRLVYTDPVNSEVVTDLVATVITELAASPGTLQLESLRADERTVSLIARTSRPEEIVSRLRAQAGITSVALQTNGP